MVDNPESLTRSIGTYIFELRVTDGYGLSDMNTATITVSEEENVAPIALVCDDYQEFTMPHDGEAGGLADVFLMASCSSDADQLDVLSYEWLDEDGNSVGTTDNINLDLEELVIRY